MQQHEYDTRDQQSDLTHTINLARRLTIFALDESRDPSMAEALRTHKAIASLNLYPRNLDELFEKCDDIREWVESAQ